VIERVNPAIGRLADRASASPQATIPVTTSDPRWRPARTGRVA